MDTTTDFVPFPKIPRLNRDVVVTEKIDGTNASVLVHDDGETYRVGSRNRWITQGDDNFGFARYVAEHEETFLQLGPGLHRGEWWGQGIQRGYGLDHKRFSLFNTSQWNDETPPPEGLYVAPVLYDGPYAGLDVDYELDSLIANGSSAVWGYARPEGIVVYHVAARQYFKATCEGDESPKGVAA